MHRIYDHSWLELYSTMNEYGGCYDIDLHWLKGIFWYFFIPSTFISGAAHVYSLHYTEVFDIFVPNRYDDTVIDILIDLKSRVSISDFTMLSKKIKDQYFSYIFCKNDMSHEFRVIDVAIKNLLPLNQIHKTLPSANCYAVF